MVRSMRQKLWIRRDSLGRKFLKGLQRTHLVYHLQMLIMIFESYSQRIKDIK
jgi:hypothetical protein